MPTPPLVPPTPPVPTPTPFNATQAYAANAVVSFNGVNYVATIAVPAGHTPPNVSYWKVQSVGAKPVVKKGIEPIIYAPGDPRAKK